jgi:hypothetical protein
MAYNLKDVFYLDTTATVTKATAGTGSSQLDLSAYIDPIARGRQKGTGLAIYRVHWAIQNGEDTNVFAPDPSETGVLTCGLVAGAGLGDNATGAIALPAGSNNYAASNQLLVSAGMYYSPAAYPGSDAKMDVYIDPSDDVPYVIVRDNVCLTYTVDAAATFADEYDISVRIECAQVTLDQATLNQLLRTQTV